MLLNLLVGWPMADMNVLRKMSSFCLKRQSAIQFQQPANRLTSALKSKFFTCGPPQGTIKIINILYQMKG